MPPASDELREDLLAFIGHRSDGIKSAGKRKVGEGDWTRLAAWVVQPVAK